MAMKSNISVARQTTSLYWQHVRNHKPAAATGLITGALGVLAGQFIAPLVIANSFDRLSEGNIDNFWHVFGPALALYAGLLVFSNVMWRINVWFVWGFEVAVKKELAERCFDFLSHQTTRFHSNHFGGALVSQTNKFVNAFEKIYDIFNWNIWTNVVALMATLVILAPKAPLFVVALLAVGVFYITFMIARVKRQFPYMAAEASAESAQTAQLADVITNVNAVKTFAHEPLEARLFAAKTHDVVTKTLKNRTISTVNDSIYSGLYHIMSWLALFFGLYMVSVHHAPIGTFFLISNYTFNLLDRLWNMTSLMRNLNRAYGDAYDMTEILHQDIAVTDAPHANKLRSIRGDIAIDNIRFAYAEHKDRPLFDNFFLHIKPGEKVGLVGHSGSGKTSLVKLLLRFSNLDGGEIRIDQRNIAQVTQASLRRAIAYVPQEPLMFHRTIAENIRYGQLQASDDAVIAAAKMANAHEFIERLPNGYDTLVGERGTKLSGGQRQRVAIARAMLKNAPILLLDEATSALDSESETLIQEALWKLMDGRTAIVIAHRLSTIQKMDRILVLDHGKIVEEGSHKALLAQNGTYAKLWAHQSGGFIED